MIDEMQQEINAVKEAIQEAELEIISLNNSIRDLEWEQFDYLQEQIENITEEAEFLIDLLSYSDLFTDNGQLTDEGTATMGLYAQNYNVYMAQADQYAEEIAAIDEEIAALEAEGSYDTELIERRQELLEAQQDCILAAEDTKQAIVDLVAEGIELELDALQELIDAYEDSLDAAYDLFTYQKDVEEQAANIASLQKQISAYSGDTSEETKATIQQLQVELAEAEEDLEETQYEQYISDQKQLLDDLYDEYELILDERLDNVDALIEEMITYVNENSSEIASTISSATSDVGYTVTEAMSSIWESGTAYDIVTTYGDSFNTALTTVNTTLSDIKTYISNMVSTSDTAATATTSTTSTTTSTTKSTSSSSSSSSSKKTTTSSSSSTQGDGTVQVGDKVTFKSGKYYYDSYGSKPTGSKYLGKSVYVTKINSKSNATKPYHISTGKKLGSGDLGWLTKSQITGYKTGGLVDYTGLAQLHGTPDEPEQVLNAEDTERFAILTAAMESIANGTSPLAALFGGSGSSDVLSDLSSGDGVDIGSSNTSIGSVNYEINIPIDHVEDYDDLVNQMVKDEKFEKFIQSMTVDRLTGGSKLAKNKYQW